MEPEARYAKSGDLGIAYQVTGTGPDLVMIPGMTSSSRESPTCTRPTSRRSWSNPRTLPRRVIFLDALPRTSVGKVGRKRSRPWPAPG